MVVMASVKSLPLVVVNLIIVSGVLAQDLQLEGELLARQPENGLVQKDQVMKCLTNGEVLRCRLFTPSHVHSQPTLSKLLWPTSDELYGDSIRKSPQHLKTITQ